MLNGNLLTISASVHPPWIDGLSMSQSLSISVIDGRARREDVNASSSQPVSSETISLEALHTAVQT